MKTMIKRFVATPKKLAVAVAASCLSMGLTVPSQDAWAGEDTVAMEQRIQQLEATLQAMQDELARVRETAEQPMAKVEVLEERVAVVESVPHKKNSRVFFRGGFARNDTDRTGNILTDSNADNSGAGVNVGGLGVNTSDLTGNRPNGDNEAWYFGAGLEHNLTDDLWGFMDDTNVLAEIMFEYKEFDSETLNRAPLATAANDSVNAAAGTAGDVTAAVCASNLVNPGGNFGIVQNNGGPYGSCVNSVHVTQFTLSASPKVRFMNSSPCISLDYPCGFCFSCCESAF